MNSCESVILDKKDPLIRAFRQEVLCKDFGLEPELLDRDENYLFFKKNYANIDFEDIYKFSYRKWNQTHFDILTAMLVDKKVVSLAGAQIYPGNNLRVGMHYYTLKDYRKHLRFPLWHQKGFIQKNLEVFDQMNSLFLTVYPHNSRLKALGKKMILGRLGHLSQTEPSATVLMKKFIGHPQMIKINKAEQVLFYWPQTNPFNVYSLVNAIEDPQA